MRNIAKFSVHRPVTMSILLVVVLIFGVLSFSRIQVDLMPEMELPMLLVMTSYPGAGPEEVESQISKLMESTVATISGVKHIYSMSSASQSILMVEFDFGTDMDMASLDIRERISMVEAALPTDAGSPSYMRLNMNMMPVIQVGLTPGDDSLTLAELQQLAEDTIQPRLERIEGVASVTTTGGLEREVQVEVDQVRLNNYGLTLAQVVQFLRTDNFSTSSGEIVDGGRNYYVRNLQQFESVDDIADVALMTNTGGIVYLGDVATIVDGYKDQAQYTRINGKPAIGIACMKQSDANTSEACIAVKEAIAELEQEIGLDLEFHTIMDQSLYVQDSLDNTMEHLLIGAVLALLVLFLFLRNVRSTLIVGLSIPVSVIATFILLYYNGSTLNIITLGGLALGIGRIIDDSIVVFENVYRHRSEGISPVEAAINGTGEVGGAVLASTLTLMAVFVPIAISGGLAGMIFSPFAFTIIFAILCSLLVSLTIVPLLSSRVLSDKAMIKLSGQSKFAAKFSSIGSWIDNWGEIYKKLLAKALNHRKLVLISVSLAFFVSCGLFALVGMEFMPVTDEGQITISIESDKGNTLDSMDEIVQIAEERIGQVPEADLVYVSVGSGSVMMTGASPNNATIYVMLSDLELRSRSSEEVSEELRGMFADIPGAKFEVSASSNSMSTGSPISIEIKGDDLEVLQDLSDQALALVQTVEGTREVSSSLVEGNMEVQISVNRRLAAIYGLSPIQVANAVSNANSGVVASQYRVGGEEIDIRVKYAGEGHENLDNLKNLTMMNNMGNPVILSQVADFNTMLGPTSIDRTDQSRIATISGDIINRDLASVIRDIQAKLSTLNLPVGYTITYGGANEQMNDSFADLLIAFLAALILVYAVLAIQYESFLNPLIIMFSIPLSLIGVVLGLLLTGRAFSVTSFIGLIMLLGIVVANAIVYIDYLEKLRERGMERREAILEAGRLRLRPILMTAFATMLAMIPLAIGSGSSGELMAPLATVVISGLLVSTILTLFFIPISYSVMDDWRERFNRRASRKRSAALPPEEVAEI